MAQNGRPTKYSVELEEKALDYVSGRYQDEGDIIPSIAGMAIYLGITRTTLYDWAKDENKNFSYILEVANTAQEKTLLNGGLSNEMNATIVKLALGKQGYHDKADNTLSGPDGKPVQTDSIFEFIPVGSNDSSKAD